MKWEIFISFIENKFRKKCVQLIGTYFLAIKVVVMLEISFAVHLTSS